MKDIRIKTLENGIDDLEQYSKMDNIVISGVNVQHRTYARTSSNFTMDSYTVQEACASKENVLAILNNHNIPIKKRCFHMSPIEIKKQRLSYSLEIQQQGSKTGRDKKYQKT